MAGSLVSQKKILLHSIRSSETLVKQVKRLIVFGKSCEHWWSVPGWSYSGPSCLNED